MKKFAGLVVLLSFAIGGCTQGPNHNMALIQGGTFSMGSPGGEAERDIDERIHQVTVDSFYIGKYEVTQGEYQQIMKEIPSNFKGNKLPVESVSWFNALLFCNKLSEKRGLTPAYAIDGTSVGWDKTANGYRLPTEAEWEYACRAGTDTPFNTGMNITTDQANFDGNYPYNNNAIGKSLERTVRVGSYPANAWGLYDMHGNVYEWCWDWHTLYTREDQTNPTGPASGSYHVIRGGAWVTSGYALRSASRGVYLAGDGNERIGFRLARNAD
jgi:formylglycine-generating enzyme required for sulfatase activity